MMYRKMVDMDKAREGMGVSGREEEDQQSISNNPSLPPLHRTYQSDIHHPTVSSGKYAEVNQGFDDIPVVVVTPQLSEFNTKYK